MSDEMNQWLMDIIGNRIENLHDRVTNTDDPTFKGADGEIKQGYVNANPPPPIQLEEIALLVESTYELLRAVASRVGVYDDRAICRCQCQNEQPKTEDGNSNIIEKFDNGEGAGYTIFGL